MSKQLPPAGLYALLDTNWVRDGGESDAAAQAARGGACMLQYRDKLGRPLRRLVAVVDQAQRELGCPVIVNDDIDLALEVGAAGVHLGQGDGDPAAARQRLGEAAIIGVTCHASLDLARRTLADGADYVSFGRFFPSRTKPGAPGVTLEFLRQARAELGAPLVAIGGINLDNGAHLIQAGADFLAVAGDIFGQPDIERRSAAFAQLFD